VPYHGTKIFASLSEHLAAQGLAGHLIQFEAGFAPSSSPCIVAAVTYQSKFFDKLRAQAYAWAPSLSLGDFQ